VPVLPEAEEVDVKIDQKICGLIISVIGSGGQSVNTTYSAVRLTHMPTGVVISMQDEKSQSKTRESDANFAGAVAGNRRTKVTTRRRRTQIASRQRRPSEKIRTYNFKENRVTDHRIGMTVHQLDLVMEGALDDFIEALVTHYQTEKLKAKASLA
jgi:peptide chain release factor 1